MIGKTVFSTYDIIGTINTGSMSTVYKAEHRLHKGQYYAVKVLHSESQPNKNFGNDLEQEGEKMSLLSHPNIIKVHSAAKDKELDRYCIVMDYFEGKDLGQFIRAKGRLSKEETLTIGLQIASALIHMREVGMIHCDLHTGNIRVQQAAGKALDIRILDLGMSAIIKRGEPTLPLPFGAPPYLSLERAKGEGVDDRSDVFSLGLLLHEMLTGRNHFSSYAKGDIIAALSNHTEELSLSFHKETPKRLQRLILNLVKKDPNHRISLEDFIKEANGILRWEHRFVFCLMAFIAAIGVGGYFYSLSPQKEVLPTPSLQGQTENEHVIQENAEIKKEVQAPQKPLLPVVKATRPPINQGDPRAEKSEAVPVKDDKEKEALPEKEIREIHETGKESLLIPAPLPPVEEQPLPIIVPPDPELVIIEKGPDPPLPATPPEKKEINREDRLRAMKIQLDDFKKAYEDEDLAALQKTTAMSPKTAQDLEKIFIAYSNITISISDPVLDGQGQLASAQLEVTSLTDRVGNPASIRKKKATLQFQNVEGQWKIHW